MQLQTHEILALAKALESSIFQALLNAQNDPSREDRWRRHADRLESKFTNEFGRHYSLFLYPNTQ